MTLSVRIQGEKELEAAIAKASADAPRAMDRALEDWGKPTLAAAVARAPKLSGELAGSGSLTVRNGKGELVFDAEHAPVLDLAGRGKYRSLVDKYGAPPRFGYGTVIDEFDRLEQVSDKYLEPVVTLNGWAG